MHYHTDINRYLCAGPHVFCLGFPSPSSHRSGRIQLFAYRQGNGIVRELAVAANLRPFWFDKPAMVYWLMSISYSFFGFTDFASRLPAAFCGAATITLLVWYIRRITKNNVVAVWSSIMLATSLEFWIISHAIITDSMLMLFTVPTLLSAYIGLMENNRRHMVIAYFSSGLACLSKGPVGLVLPGMLLLIWCGLMRNKNYSSVSFPGRESLSSSSLPSLVRLHVRHTWRSIHPRISRSSQYCPCHIIRTSGR